MDRNFTQLYGIIYQIYLASPLKTKFGETKLGLAKCLGFSQGKTQAWEKGQWPKASDIEVLANTLGLDYEWLVTGQGEPTKKCGHEQSQEKETDATPHSHPTPPKPIPVYGLASCGIEGWNAISTITMSSVLPSRPEMLAAIAFGESMMPAGIFPGQICYCDPTQPPLEGDAVFVERIDKVATIKVFVGECPGKAEHLRFQGWRQAKDDTQTVFFLDLAARDVKTIAPVIYIRRRI